MSKQFSIVVRYEVEDEQIIEADSIEDAENKLQKLIDDGLLFPGNIIDSMLDEAEIVSSTEVA